MTQGQIIVLVTPLFVLAMVAEWVWSTRRHHPTYALDDAINSLSLGMLSQVVGVLGGLVTLGAYTLAYRHLALWQADDAWLHPLGWLLALVLYDFCYYWMHRKSHEVAVLWAAHVVHHQSQRYNLSTALRQTSSGFLLGWVFFLPMALAGVPPLVFAVVALVDLLYQFWVHTEQVGRLGWFDRWFCSPSNHRVHHAVNDRYLDRNHGGIFMLWDHLFGTFEPEDPAEPCVYGTRAPLNSWNPLWANAEVYTHLWRTSQRAGSWADKWRVWVKPPGWLPADVAASHPSKPFDMGQTMRFATPLPPGDSQFAAAQWVLMLALTASFLWLGHTLDRAAQLTAVAGLAVAFWAQGAHLQRQLNAWACLMVQAAVVSTLSAAWGWTALHFAAKPATMLFAIIYIAINTNKTSDGGVFYLKKWWLLAAATCSLAGDVLLMLSPSLFVAGLAAFLLAHLCFLVLFSRDAPWFASRVAVWCTLALGVGMYAVLLTGLPTQLQLPVAAYVLAIAAMAAQAIGRAVALDTPSARRVAMGAVAFMCSDALLGINRFVQPLPMSAVWVLSTYYLAQVLMVCNVLRTAEASGRAVTSAD
ncbi:MAG: sterol desaturase family protein [Burkholderiales bacterium]|nr:sterol desaturase family protein [Burkholderiales bacterium]